MGALDWGKASILWEAACFTTRRSFRGLKSLRSRWHYSCSAQTLLREPEIAHGIKAYNNGSASQATTQIYTFPVDVLMSLGS